MKKDICSLMKIKLECPLCKEAVANPDELRNHRLKVHRDSNNVIEYHVLG